MALEKADLTTINKYVRDVVNRVPPRPIKAHTIGTLTSEQINVSAPPVVGGVQQPKITTRALSLGPPPNPNDGDIWVARDVDANGTRWMFQYNVGSSSTFKWEFIGGPSARAVVATFQTTAISGAWVDVATIGPSFVVARAGDYEVSYGFDAAHTVANAKLQMGPAIGAGTPVDNVATYDNVANGFNSAWRSSFMPGLAAANEIRARYFTGTAGTMTVGNRQLYVQPIRVS